MNIEEARQLKNIKGCIYKITSPTGRVYIGKTVCFSERMRHYSKATIKTQRLLYHSFLKYGVEIHAVEILEECQKDEELLVLEKLYIEKYNTYQINNKKGMNLTLGGEGSCKYPSGFRNSPEVKTRNRELQKVREASPNAKAMRSEWGKKWRSDPKVRDKLRARQKARRDLAEVKVKMAEYSKAKWSTDMEYRTKVKEQRRIKNSSPEKKAILAARARAWRSRPENKAKVSLARKIKYNNSGGREYSRNYYLKNKQEELHFKNV